jgi:cytochrome c556
VQFTQDLGAASRKAADAAKARNVKGVLEAGDAMFEVCEGCHNRYMKK